MFFFGNRLDHGLCYQIISFGLCSKIYYNNFCFYLNKMYLKNCNLSAVESLLSFNVFFTWISFLCFFSQHNYFSDSNSDNYTIGFSSWLFGFLSDFDMAILCCHGIFIYILCWVNAYLHKIFFLRQISGLNLKKIHDLKLIYQKFLIQNIN